MQMQTNVVVNTQGLNLDERPDFFVRLMPQVAALRAKTGRPHWLLIDEAHHLLPEARKGLTQVMPEDLPATVFITVHPAAMSPSVLKKVAVVIALGDGASGVIESFCQAIGIAGPAGTAEPSSDQVLVRARAAGTPPR